jgi:hypothetical protein
VAGAAFRERARDGQGMKPAPDTSWLRTIDIAEAGRAAKLRRRHWQHFSRVAAPRPGSYQPASPVTGVYRGTELHQHFELLAARGGQMLSWEQIEIDREDDGTITLGCRECDQLIAVVSGHIGRWTVPQYGAVWPAIVEVASHMRRAKHSDLRMERKSLARASGLSDVSFLPAAILALVLVVVGATLPAGWLGFTLAAAVAAVGGFIIALLGRR